jgi:acyl dehydratase
VSRRVHYRDLPGLAGADLGASEWMLVDQEMIDQFARTTRDEQWIHVDRERARRERGGTIAHGFLALSLLPALTEHLLVIDGVDHVLNYGLDRVRFLAPLPSGTRIRGLRSVLSVEEKPAGRLLLSRITMEAEGGAKPVFVAESLALIVPAAA